MLNDRLYPNSFFVDNFKDVLFDITSTEQLEFYHTSDHTTVLQKGSPYGGALFHFLKVDAMTTGYVEIEAVYRSVNKSYLTANGTTRIAYKFPKLGLFSDNVTIKDVLQTSINWILNQANLEIKWEKELQGGIADANQR